MPSPAPIDPYALFDDVVLVAKKAHAPTAGWRAICVRARRTLGKKVTEPLSNLDLDEEVGALTERVRRVAGGAPEGIDTLVFSLFDGVDDDGAGIFTGFHLSGRTGVNTELRWLMEPPDWVPADADFASPVLDAIAREALAARGEVRKAVAHALRFGAAALLARFATADLPYRLVVAFDEGDFAEIS